MLGLKLILVSKRGLWSLCGRFNAWWRHQMETFSALLAICAGNSPVPVNSPHKGQRRGALMFSLICVWINDWVNNREAGDLRRYRDHYYVIVMMQYIPEQYITNDEIFMIFLRELTKTTPQYCPLYVRRWGHSVWNFNWFKQSIYTAQQQNKT